MHPKMLTEILSQPSLTSSSSYISPLRLSKWPYTHAYLLCCGTDELQSSLLLLGRRGTFCQQNHRPDLGREWYTHCSPGGCYRNWGWQISSTHWPEHNKPHPVYCHHCTGKQLIKHHCTCKWCTGLYSKFVVYFSVLGLSCTFTSFELRFVLSDHSWRIQ